MADIHNLESRLSPEGKFSHPSVEAGSADNKQEKKAEQNLEQVGEVRKEEKSTSREVFRDVLAKVKGAKPAAYDSERSKDIDGILEEGLGDIFLKMDPTKQKEFKEEGEKAVIKIDHLLSKAKVNMRKIFQTIKRWLVRIPGINRFFLEQEAKIKTDRIMRLKP